MPSVSLEKAIALLNALADEMARHELTAQLQEHLGDVRMMLTQYGAARDAYATALTVVLDTDKVTQARLQRKIGKVLENERADFTRVRAQYEKAEALLGRPDECAEAAWWEEWCQVQLEHLILLYWWDRSADMAALVERVRPSIERHGTPAQWASLFENMSRQLNRQNRFAPSDMALQYARAAFAAVSLSAGPEARSFHQFSLGFNLLWHGDLAEARATLQAALEMAEQTGDVSLQARCLAYLAVTCRRQHCAVEAEAYARRGLAVAEATSILYYIGSTQASLAWVAWRRGDLVEAERLAQAALDVWRVSALPYPLYWQAWLPLLSIALNDPNSLEQAVELARQLIDPRQQKLPDPIEPLLQQAIDASQAGDAITTRRLLNDTIDHAQSIGYL